MDHYFNVPVPKTVLNNKFLFANLDGKSRMLHYSPLHNLDSLVFFQLLHNQNHQLELFVYIILLPLYVL